MTQNYYEKKFLDLQNQFDNATALSKIVQIFLYGRAPKLKFGENIHDIFWNSFFIDLLDNKTINTEEYIYALSKYIKTIKINNYNSNILEKISLINETCLINAIKLANIPSDFKTTSWENLVDHITKFNNKTIINFISEANNIRKMYLAQQKNYNELKNRLNLTQLDAISLTGLYSYHFLVNELDIIKIPFQINMGEFYSLRKQDVWAALDEIIQHSRAHQSLSEKNINHSIEKVYRILLNSNRQNSWEYNVFCQLVANYTCLNIIKKDILPSYMTSFLSNSYNDDNWENKFSVLSLYNKMIGTVISNQIVDFQQNENLYMKTSAAEACGILFWLQNIYGITELIIDNKKINLMDAIHLISNAQIFYLIDYLYPFLNDYQHDGFPNSLLNMMTDGFLKGKLRSVFAFDKLNDKARSLVDWISSDESKTQKTKRVNEILQFWSNNLNNQEKNINFSDKPFYIIDNYIFFLPQRLTWQTLYTTTVNRIRKVEKNRKELRKETELIELNLAQLFREYGFNVIHSLEPKNSDAGEIDLIISQNDIILLIELKSSYLRNSISGVHEYRLQTLNKAAYQLDRKLDYIKNKYPNKKYFSWIVDTTLEFDHQHIGKHLKISLEELVIILRNESNFLEKWKILFNLQQKDISESDISLSKKFKLLELIQYIENNQFWEENLKQIQEINSITKIFKQSENMN